MAQRVDIALVRRSVTIEQILAHYGLLDKLTRKGDSLIGACPIHHGTNKTQFHVSLSKNAFRCFGDCGSDPRLHNGGGNMISFVIAMEDIAVPDDPDQHQAARTAALRIADWFGIGASQKYSHITRSAQTAPIPPPPPRLTTELQSTEQPADEPLVNAPLKFELRDLDADHAYLKERSFTPETIAYFGVGYFPGRGLMQGRVAIPIRDADGTLVAYAGRWPGNEPPEGEGKYRLPNGFHKSLVVYNLHRAKACAREHGLVVVEGFFDTMRLHQLGVCHAVALMGSTLSQAQEDLIVDTVGPQGKVTLLFDGDTSGRTCTHDALARLGNRVYAKALLLPDGKQPDQLTKDELRQLGR